jgi:hypothetical protein
MVMTTFGDELVVQVGSRGYYGKITVELVATDDGSDVTVEFAPNVGTLWRPGAAFGIHYVLDRVAKRKFFPNGGKVRVTSITGHAVDTTNLVIAFVAARALYKALGIQPTKPPQFDEQTGVFGFPNSV